MEKCSKTPQRIKKMFNQIANNYDKLNTIMTFGLHKYIKKDVINSLNINIGAEILDLCTGTGDLAGILKQKYPQAKIVGVDFSDGMLERAKIKNPEIEFLNADGTKLPFQDEQFDLCIISFGLRNTEDIPKMLSEIYRILKHGGSFINLDLGKPNKFLNIFLKPYMYLWVAFLGKIFNGDETPYKYLAISNEDFPSQYRLVEMFEEVGFSDVKNKNYLFGQIASQSSKK